MEEVIDTYLLDEFIDKEPIITKLDAIRAKLESTSISKVKQLRLKILLDARRHRVQSIIRRTADAMGKKEEMVFIRKQHS